MYVCLCVIYHNVTEGFKAAYESNKVYLIKAIFFKGTLILQILTKT